MENIFHLYGLIVGVAIVVAILLIEHQYKKLGFLEDYFWKIIVSVLFFGVIGARIWHVVTDFYLYENSFKEAFYIWDGGLSIFGGVFGGVVGLNLVIKFLKSSNFNSNFSSKSASEIIEVKKFLDIAVFGLPVGQAIGRLGNFVNQELYGKPVGEFFEDSIFSFLKVYIKPENRLFGYENIDYYHPLFFYEMFFVIIFVAAIYYLYSEKNKKKTSQLCKLVNKIPTIGTGKLFLIYILYYSFVRFFLDFLRMDKVLVGQWSSEVLNSGMTLNIGINQLILIFVFIFTSYLFFRKRNV